MDEFEHKRVRDKITQVKALLLDQLDHLELTPEVFAAYQEYTAEQRQATAMFNPSAYNLRHDTGAYEFYDAWVALLRQAAELGPQPEGVKRWLDGGLNELGN